jgi:hypothetical protein
MGCQEGILMKEAQGALRSTGRPETSPADSIADLPLYDRLLLVIGDADHDEARAEQQRQL